ncbi:type VI secretion protein IcmF/TssM N-terminal domain-containing protein [Marinospirillum perlucidum]|uniref:type VI secretion protein IcmF/TssM N-terminal domain-containing protein n=1 Tax=Marinospirillum perlucidum TaxID=1982602 RepID=UPI000DF36E7B|nr:type VI secretion protein IcmF/TssM N-terminal domain-containing protein [Marinospirillum perlucidum]
MKTFLKILLFIFVWALIAGAVVFVALLLGYPLATGITATLALFGLWLLYRLGKWGLARWRARARAKRLLQEGEPDTTQASANEDTQQLDASFKGLMRFMKDSPLVDKGLEPEYALPWYLYLGEEEQAGDLLKGGRVSLPTDMDAQLNKEGSAISWWPFNESLLVQIPNHLYKDLDEQDAEWRHLLYLLSKKRSEEPINGLILPIDWSWLESQSEDNLFEQGLELRNQLGQMMKVIKTRFPVYFVLTGMEKLDGVANWQEQLPTHLKDQAVGQLNNQQQEADEFIEGSLVHIAERLKDLNVYILRGGDLATDALVLPTRLAELQGRLHQFTRGVFQESVFEELPRLRGFYLASSLPGEGEQKLPQGLFCHDFFTKVLPNERNQTEKVPAAVRAEKAIRNTWVAGYAAVFILVLVTLGFIYRQDTLFLENMTERYAGQLIEQSDFNNNIDVNYSLASLLEQLEEHSFLPWLNDVTATPDFQLRLNRMLVKRVEQNLIDPLDKHLQFAAEKQLFETDLVGDELSREMARFVGQLVREINLLQALEEGADEAALRELPPAYTREDDEVLASLDIAQLNALNNLYLDFLIRHNNPQKLEARLQTKRARLQRILSKSPGSLDWLIDWGNQAAREAEVRLGEFWRGIRAEQDVRVPAAFTAEGKAQIDDFIEQLLATQEVDENAARVDELIPGFQESYRARYLDAWKNFALNFQSGVDVLSGDNTWRQAVDLQATTRNQHFALLDRMAVELEPFMDEEAPEWVHLVSIYEAMKAFAPDAAGEDKSALQKMALKLLKKVGKLGKLLAKIGKSAAKAQDGSGPTPEEQEMMVERAAALLGEYQSNIRGMAQDSQIPSIAHLSMLDLYANPDNPAQGQTSLAAGYGNLADLQGLLGRNTDFNEPFWAVFRGPLNMFRRYLVQQSADEMQELWEQNFLAATDGVPQERMADYLYGPEGLVWIFKAEHLDTFIERRFGAGFAPKRAFGTPYPLNDELLNYLARADEFKKQKQDYYSVILSTRPISTNPGARRLPSSMLLQLQCEEGLQEVENSNYRVDAEFVWTPDCTNVRLTIQVENYSLVKNYRGPYGFPEFLEDFADGAERISVDEFPLYADRLAEWNIDYFDLQFGLRGHGRVIDVLSASRQRLPRYIVD